MSTDAEWDAVRERERATWGAIAHRFKVGERVRLDERYGYPAKFAIATICTIEPYHGNLGYYISWDYGRPKLMNESAGGWVSEIFIIGLAVQP